MNIHIAETKTPIEVLGGESTHFIEIWIFMQF